MRARKPERLVAFCASPAGNCGKLEVFEYDTGTPAPTLVNGAVMSGNVVMAVGCYGNDSLNPTIIAAEIGTADDPEKLSGYWGPLFLNSFGELMAESEFEMTEGKIYKWTGEAVYTETERIVRDEEDPNDEYTETDCLLTYTGRFAEVGNFTL